MNFEQALKIVYAAVDAKKIKRHLKDVEEVVLRGSWEGLTYDKIAEGCNYAPKYLKQDVGPKLWKLLSEALGEEVSKTNFRAAVERHWRSLIPPHSELKVEETTAPDFVGRKEVIADKLLSWGETVDLLVFYGRAEELEVELKQWIADNRCRLETLFGMGVIGKTALYMKLTEQV